LINVINCQGKEGRFFTCGKYSSLDRYRNKKTIEKGDIRTHLLGV